MGLANQWKYQVRINLGDEAAAMARCEPDNPALRPLAAVLRRHGAALKCQYDAFAGYVAEAEKNGPDGYHLYAWTKATIEDPEKKAKYLKSFTLYVDGQEVYAKDKADPLERDLRPLVESGLIARMTKHDTNPANNPQPPARYRK
jgi:hypothetical protein